MISSPSLTHLWSGFSLTFILILITSSGYCQSVLDLQLELDKANFSLKESPGNRFLLLSTLSSKVEQTCLSKTYPKSSNSPECLAAIEEAKSFEPSLPSIVCATNGVDSEACSMSYSDIEVKPFNNEIEGVGDKFSSPNNLQSLVDSFREKPDFDPKKLLDAACRFSGIHKNNIEEPQAEISLDSLANPFETKVRGPKFTRFLSSDCLSAIKLAESYKLSTCYRFGFYSPFCSNVMKMEKGETPKKKETGLASF